MKLDLIQEAVKSAIYDAGFSYEQEINISTALPQFGDFSTNCALIMAKQVKKNPLEVAQLVVKAFKKPPDIASVDIVKPGFINFWMSDRLLLTTAQNAAQNSFEVKPFSFGKNKKIMLEYAHPNTHKLFHVGHLRNISIGESVSRLLEEVGNTVIRANYQGDVGLHIAKCLWGLKQHLKTQDVSTISSLPLYEKIKLLGSSYAKGQIAYETDKAAKLNIIQINKHIYEQSPNIMDLWTTTRQWSLDYYDSIYKRTYVRFNRFYFESELPKRGIEIAHLLLSKGILERSQGAIVFNGKQYGLDTRVFINSLGFPTYEGKELALAEKEFSEFGELDKCIHVVTPEQSSFFKVTFKVEELVEPAKYKGKQHHLSYAFVQLKEGKMSSRTGNIIEAAWLIDEIKKKIATQFPNTNPDTTETIAIAAVKYSFLKNSTTSEIAFDIDESISLEGNSAAYLLYTYVRTQSILKKKKSIALDLPKTLLNEETTVLRTLLQFTLVVNQSASKLSPHILATYLYSLSQQYNMFYQKLPILKANVSEKSLRLLITQAVGETLKKGLFLLGIQTVDHM